MQSSGGVPGGAASVVPSPVPESGSLQDHLGNIVAMINLMNHPAWSTSVALISHTDPNVQFFGARTIYGKILDSWSASAGDAANGAMDDEERVALMQQLMQILRESAGRGDQALPAMVSSKLTESLATLALGVPVCASELLRALVSGAQTSLTNGGGVQSADAHLLLSIVSAMSEEMSENESDLEAPADAETEHAQRVLTEHAPSIRTLLAAYLREIVHRRRTLTSCDAKLDRIVAFVFTILSCPQLQGDMGVLHECGMWEPLCELLLLLLTPPEDDPDPAQLLDAATSVFAVAQIAGPRSNQRWPARDAACGVMLRTVLAAAPAYELLFARATAEHEDEDEDADVHDQLCQALARTVSCFAEREIVYLASLGTPDASKLFDFLLRLTLHPYDRHVVEAGMDVWTMLTEKVPPQARQHLRPDLFAQVTRGVLQSLAYPRAFLSWLPKPTMTPDARDAASNFFASTYLDDSDEFARIREQAAEWIHWSLEVLGWSRLVQVVGEILLRPLDADWQSREACLLVLVVLSTDASMFFEDDDDADGAEDGTATAPVARAQERAETLVTLEHIVQSLWALAPPLDLTSPDTIAASTAASRAAHPLLLAAACAFFENYVFLFDHSASPSNLAQTLQNTVAFLIACIPRTQSSATAARTAIQAGVHWLKDEAGLVPLDGCNLAGHAFRALCAHSSATRRLMLHSPATLEVAVRALMHTSGFSQHVALPMRQLWLQGLGHMVAALAHSESVEAILTPGCASLAAAAAMLRELTTPPLAALQRVIGEVTAAYKASPRFQPSAAQQAQIRHGINEPLAALLAILKAIAYCSNKDIRHRMDGLSSRILESEAAAANANTAAAVPPPSVVTGLYHAAQPLLESAVKLSLRKGGDPKSLQAVLDIHACFVTLLYPNELRPVLASTLQSAMQIYTIFPLPAVLRLVERAVVRCSFGSRAEFRDTWASLIGQVFNLTLTHSKVRNSSPDLDDRFFILCGTLFEHATVPFICNPSNTLGQLLQFCVRVLAPENANWSRQCILFLKLVLTNTDVFDALGEEGRFVRLTFRDAYKQHGESILAQLCHNLDALETIRPGDENLVALNDVLSMSLQRFPKNTNRWLAKGLVSPQLLQRIATIEGQVRTRERHAAAAAAAQEEQEEEQEMDA